MDEDEYSLKTLLNKELEAHGFISYLKLEEYLKEERVQSALEHMKSSIQASSTSEDLSALSTYVVKYAKKLFAILILLDEGVQIGILKDKKADDRLFCPHGYCTDEDLKQFFDRDDLRIDIYGYQWKIPPRLNRSKHLAFQKSDGFKAPILNDFEKERISAGSEGQVYQALFAGGHIDGYLHDTIVALKTIVVTNADTNLEYYLREVNTLRARQHEHIVPLLASYQVENKTSDGSEVIIYEVFPLAKRNMEEWMFSQKPPLILGHRRIRHRQDYILSVILNLVSALAYLHMEIDGQMAIHYDLKPQNILHFEDSEGFSQFKICDFGHSCLKSVVTGFEAGFSEQGKRGTFEYQPPEYHNSPRTNRFGPAFDIFPLGCIIVQLVTLAVFGWEDEALKEFQTVRSRNYQRRRDLSAINLENDLSFHNNLNVVKNWISKLKVQHYCTPSLRQILDFTEEMLDEDTSKRPASWELNLYFHAIISPDKLRKSRQEFYDTIPRRYDEQEGRNKMTDGPLIRATRLNNEEVIRILQEVGWPIANEAGIAIGSGLDVVQSDINFISTIPGPLNQGSLIGRYKELEGISERFAKSQFVGLYGRSGSGKSHIAYEYVQRARSKSNSASKFESNQHLFWIQAADLSSIRLSYQKIACEAKLKIQDYQEREAMSLIRKWLDDPTNGSWTMVLDGLDNQGLAKDWNCLWRPRSQSNHWRILVTTQNRTCLLEFTILTELFIEIGDVSQEEACGLLLSGLGSVSRSAKDGCNELAHRIRSPLHLKIAAKKIVVDEDAGESARRILQSLGHGAFLQQPVSRDSTLPWDLETEFKEQDSDTMLLKPIYSNRSGAGFPPESKKLLFLLAPFSKDHIDRKLMEAHYKPSEANQLTDYLGPLINHCYLSRMTDSTYSMHELIQDAVLRAIVKEGNNKYQLEYPYELLPDYEDCLCALQAKYEAQRDNGIKVRGWISSYGLKQPYMPHFERFLAYIKARSPFKCPEHRFYERAARAIITFSRQFIDDGRFDDADLVLKFVVTQGLYVDKGRADSEKRCQEITQRLLSELAKVCQRRAPGRQRMKYLKSARQYLDRAIDIAQKSKPDTLFIRLSLQRLYVMVDQEDFKAARSTLVAFQAPISTAFQQARAQLSENSASDLNELIEYERRFTVRHDQLLGYLDLKEGQKTHNHGLLQKAVNRLELADKHMVEWFPGQMDARHEIQGYLAESYLAYCTPKSLDQAENIYEIRLKMIRRRFGDLPLPKQIWDAELDLAAVSISRKQSLGTVETIQGLLDRYRTHLGLQHVDTRRCAYFLREALQLQGDSAAARHLSNEFDLLWKY